MSDNNSRVVDNLEENYTDKIEDGIIFEPYAEYLAKYKNKSVEESVKLFDSLVKEANIDVPSCQKKATVVNELGETIKSTKKVNSRFKILRVFLFITAGISLFIFILAILMYANVIYYTEKYVPLVMLLVGLVCLPASITGLVFCFKKIKELRNVIKSNQVIKNQKESELLSELYPLFNKYSYKTPRLIFNKICPGLELDTHLSKEKFDYLNRVYGLSQDFGVDSSVVGILSGTINQNPFFIGKTIDFHMGSKTYTGTKIITYTQTYTDSEGHTRTRTVTQTLTASLTRPYPQYSYNTFLCYGDTSAPNLYFRRRPTVKLDWDEKDIKSYVKKEDSRLDKLADKSIKKGGTYTRLGNVEFEALFGGEDRNNEVQFRTLFSPLAMKNMLHLIKSKEPFGDDFYFTKRGMLNYIESIHSSMFDYYLDIDSLVHYDIDKAKEMFVNYHVNYFKGIYFDLAPLLCIPTYVVDRPPNGYKTKDDPLNAYNSRSYTYYDSEIVANTFYNYIIPDECVTDRILKTSFVKKGQGGSDIFKVQAFGFRSEPRCTYVPVMGGDHCMHDVPVYWDEYFSTSCYNTIQFNRVADDDEVAEFAENQINLSSTYSDPLSMLKGSKSSSSSNSNEPLNIREYFMDMVKDNNIDANFNFSRSNSSSNIQRGNNTNSNLNSNSNSNRTNNLFSFNIRHLARSLHRGFAGLLLGYEGAKPTNPSKRLGKDSDYEDNDATFTTGPDADFIFDDDDD